MLGQGQPLRQSTESKANKLDERDGHPSDHINLTVMPRGEPNNGQTQKVSADFNNITVEFNLNTDRKEHMSRERPCYCNG